VDQFRKLGRLLERRGFSPESIAKIMGGNFLARADRIWAT
jgi:membrane dipeptidase